MKYRIVHKVYGYSFQREVRKWLFFKTWDVIDDYDHKDKDKALYMFTKYINYERETAEKKRIADNHRDTV